MGRLGLPVPLAYYDEEAETRALVDMARDITREIYTHDYDDFAELAREKEEARANRFRAP